MIPWTGNFKCNLLVWSSSLKMFKPSQCFDAERAVIDDRLYSEMAGPGRFEIRNTYHGKRIPPE